MSVGITKKSLIIVDGERPTILLEVDEHPNKAVGQVSPYCEHSGLQYLENCLVVWWKDKQMYTIYDTYQSKQILEGLANSTENYFGIAIYSLGGVRKQFITKVMKKMVLWTPFVWKHFSVHISPKTSMGAFVYQLKQILQRF